LTIYYSTGGARWHRRRRPQAERELEHVDKPEAEEKAEVSNFMNEGLYFYLKHSAMLSK
jgi:hypothetical protein